MSSVRFNHNKKRNTGLAYELLVRKVSKSLICEDRRMYGSCMRILKKYFSPGSLLDDERQLFEAIMGSRGVSKDVAAGILESVSKRASKMDFRKLDIKKSNLIRDVHKSFGKGFYGEFKLDDYRALASAQLFINSCSPKRTISEDVKRLHLEESLTKYMQSVPKRVDEQDDSVDDLSFNIAIKKFNSRYGGLSESQKNVLKSYISSFADERSGKRFVRYLNEQRGKLLGYFERVRDTGREFTDDDHMRQGLDETITMLRDTDLSAPGPRELEHILLQCRLAEEIASDG